MQCPRTTATAPHLLCQQLQLNMASGKCAIIATVYGYLASLSSLAGGDEVQRSFVADLIAFYKVNSTHL